MDRCEITTPRRSLLVVSSLKRWIKLNELERGDAASLDIQGIVLQAFYRESRKKDIYILRSAKQRIAKMS